MSAPMATLPPTPFAWGRIIPRVLTWLAGVVAGELYLLDKSPMVGVAYVVLVIALVGVMLPFTRCRYCAYWGTRCHVGFGSVVAWMYPGLRSDERLGQHRMHGLALTLHLIWMVPVGFAVLAFLRGRNMTMLVDAGILFVLLLPLDRSVERLTSCGACAQRADCPKVTPIRLLPPEDVEPAG